MKDQGQDSSRAGAGPVGPRGKVKTRGLSPRATQSHSRILRSGESYDNGSEYQQCLWLQRGDQGGAAPGPGGQVCARASSAPNTLASHMCRASAHPFPRKSSAGAEPEARSPGPAWPWGRRLNGGGQREVLGLWEEGRQAQRLCRQGQHPVPPGDVHSHPLQWRGPLRGWGTSLIIHDVCISGEKALWLAAIQPRF